MTASAERALLAAIRTRLSESSAVTALLGAPPRIADAPPPEGVFPFATFGEQRTRDNGASSTPGMEHALTLHVWSRYGGRAEVLEVLAAVRAALDGVSLTLEGHRVVFLYAPLTDVLRAEDGRTMHGILRLRAITEPV